MLIGPFLKTKRKIAAAFSFMIFTEKGLEIAFVLF